MLHLETNERSLKINKADFDKAVRWIKQQAAKEAALAEIVEKAEAVTRKHRGFIHRTVDCPCIEIRGLLIAVDKVKALLPEEEKDDLS